jgi:hypothetical protein
MKLAPTLADNAGNQFAPGKLKLELRTNVRDLIFDELANRLPDGFFLLVLEPRVDEITGCSHDRTNDAGEKGFANFAIRYVSAPGLIRVRRVNVSYEFHTSLHRLWLYDP